MLLNKTVTDWCVKDTTLSRNKFSKIDFTNDMSPNRGYYLNKKIAPLYPSFQQGRGETFQPL